MPLHHQVSPSTDQWTCECSLTATSPISALRTWGSGALLARRTSQVREVFPSIGFSMNPPGIFGVDVSHTLLEA